jgi:hypothetical protein
MNNIVRDLASISLMVVFIIFDGFISRLMFPGLSRTGIRRFILSQSKLLVTALYIWGAIRLATGNNAFTETVVGFAAAVVFGLVMEMLWEFISPYKLPDIEVIASKITGDQLLSVQWAIRARVVLYLVFSISVCSLPITHLLPLDLRNAWTYIAIVGFLSVYFHLQFHAFSRLITDDSGDE